jgi:hypothetical protein
MAKNKKIAVVAIGGNSLITDRAHRRVEDQYEAAKETTSHIVCMIEAGWEVVISHGNGPQVGFILRRSELAAHELHEIPLDVCGADSQGAIGYALQQNLYNHLRRKGIVKDITTGADDRRTVGRLWRTPAAAGGGWYRRRCPSASSKNRPSNSSSPTASWSLPWVAAGYRW